MNPIRSFGINKIRPDSRSPPALPGRRLRLWVFAALLPVLLKPKDAAVKAASFICLYAPPCTFYAACLFRNGASSRSISPPNLHLLARNSPNSAASIPAGTSTSTCCFTSKVEANTSRVISAVSGRYHRGTPLKRSALRKHSQLSRQWMEGSRFLAHRFCKCSG